MEQHEIHHVNEPTLFELLLFVRAKNDLRRAAELEPERGGGVHFYVMHYH